MNDIFSSIYIILPDFTQPLTEISNRNRKIMFLGSRMRPLRRADSLTALCEMIVCTMWDPRRLTTP
jgi:hypothetical protein